MSLDCRSELLTRVRRGVATEPDRLAFDAHLGACESCRFSWELAQDFDAVGAAEPGDAELLARIASVAIGGAALDVRREGAPVRPDNDVRHGDDLGPHGSGLAGARGARWKRGAWLYAAAAVLACGVAAAALVQRRPAPEPTPSVLLLQPSLRAVVS
ncbi:MAG TPA: hypothetical protein VL242_21310, partial [Sorangium sp.]|nr:hypothetical protein [Sorangium sp.]